MGFAKAGTAVENGANVALQGVKPSGMAAQGNVFWRAYLQGSLHISLGNPSPPSGWITADGFALNGTPFAYTNTIDLTTAAHPAPMAVYQNLLYAGVLSLAVGPYDPAKLFTLRFHWMEPNAGGRTLNIAINSVLTVQGIDILTATGGLFRAYSYDLPSVSPDPATNQIRIDIAAFGANPNPFLCGLEVLPS